MARFVFRLLPIAVLLAATVELSLAAPAQASTARAGAAAAQTRLTELGYLPAGVISGVMDERTHQALVAFQGWEGIERTGVAGPATLARLAQAARPRPLPGAGSRVEVHLLRQVALLIRGNRVERALHVSTGAPATPTPVGDFRVYRKERQSWSVPFNVWLPWASYFNLGIALHGSPDVPAYPASHGCVRIPLAEASAVYAFARLGVSVHVVR
jgi:hypothetical protein